MKKTLLTLLVLATLCACSKDKQKELGFLNVAPDETKIETRNPLTIPPSFGQKPVVNK